MIRLAASSLRRCFGSFLASLLAIGLLAAGGLLLASALTAKPPADRFAAAPIMVSGARDVFVTTRTVKKKGKVKVKTKGQSLIGAGSVPADVIAKIKTLPQVTAVIPDVAFPVRAQSPAQQLSPTGNAPIVAHGWSSAGLTPYSLRTGNAPLTGQAVIDADLADRAHLEPGDVVTLTSRTGTRKLTISGVTAGSLPAQAAVFLSDTEALEFSGLPGPTALAVWATGPLPTEFKPLTGDDRVNADLPGARPDYVGPISTFGFVIGITAFAAIFVLTGTVTLAVRQRLRELALLRTIGATPGQLRRLLGRESVLLALLAAVPGLPLGVGIAALTAARFRTIGAVPPQFTLRVNPLVLLAATAAGVLVSFLAARIAGRRAVRIAPTQALTETAVQPRGGMAVRIALALLTTAGAAGVLTFVPLDGKLGVGMCFISSALLLCAVATAGPLLVRALTRPVSRLLGTGGPIGRLARMITKAEPRRVAAVAVPLVLLFAVNTTMLLATSLTDDLAQEQQDARNAPAGSVITDPMPLAAARQIMDKARNAAALLPTQAVVAGGGKPEHYAAQGLLTTGTSALDLGFTQGGFRQLAAGDAIAKEYGWHVGDRVHVWLADGTAVDLRLDGIFTRSRGFGDLVLPADLVAAHDPKGLVTAINIRGTGTARSTITPPKDAPTQEGAWELMVLISAGFTAIAVCNTFAIATAGRRREFAGLRFAGATIGQLRRLAAREALITVGVALLLGAGVCAVVIVRFSLAQDGTFRLFVNPIAYAVMAAATAALGLLAGIVPARLAIRK